ncbi:UPF0575 protein C19orf67 homolog [Dunckerocampus dactyliophorus]|uniref:UPF0575 protein C19orf67 homolog n=1 Tax=Dunckerocampus dactyliophorus TaxID=161453 RepID=UPI002405C2F2|nr:UPF0575 protein C19orf67 homolog [Dunckerocampus dactyliophorus]XP_054635414.1 UPF0575 protein C19orf67 homolog [Dunckerocampus dactyliophorus]
MDAKSVKVINPLPGQSVQTRQWMKGMIQSLQLQVQFFHSKAVELYYHIIKSHVTGESGLVAASVRSFIYACQPFFNFLESTARNKLLPYDIMHVQLLQISQQLCDALEHLVLSLASHSLLSLEEIEPDNLSHFCIGQTRLGQRRLTMFLYCKPAPYLAGVATGLFKRMRWNVERTAYSAEKDPETEYYFLCYEDIPNPYADLGVDVVSCDSSVLRMWSIGQWVQVKPDVNTEDISDWITCDVPQAAFNKLLFLGSKEPSSCIATDHLMQMLMSQQDE